MIYLFTGTPGAGKTINAIRWINESEQFKDRPIYYFQIDELKLPWIRLENGEFSDWYNLPDGAVIVVDEAQFIIPPRKQGSAVPPHIEQFATHRHRGHDVILITQHPTLIDSFVRHLVTEHRHVMRPFALGSSVIHTHQGVCSTPDSPSSYKMAEKSRVKLDKRYFGLYKSAVMHTGKGRLPLIFWVFVVSIALLVTLAVYFYFSFFHEDKFAGLKTDQASSSVSMDFPGSVSGGPQSKSPLTASEYARAQVPRDSALPWTAPVYDDIRQPVTYPVLSCVLHAKSGDCRCFTQQMTRYFLDKDACVYHVKYGHFDYAQADAGSQHQNQQQDNQPTPQPRASGHAAAPAWGGSESRPRLSR